VPSLQADLPNGKLIVEFRLNGHFVQRPFTEEILDKFSDCSAILLSRNFFPRDVAQFFENSFVIGLLLARDH